MSVIEKIKRTAHAFKLAKLSQTGNLSEFLKDNLVIPVDEVLHLLETEFQELRDLLKTRPIWTEGRADWEIWFEVYEKKFVEVLGEQKK